MPTTVTCSACGATGPGMTVEHAVQGSAARERVPYRIKAMRYKSTPETEKDDDAWMNDLVKNIVAKLGLHEIPAVVKETFSA